MKPYNLVFEINICKPQQMYPQVVETFSDYDLAREALVEYIDDADTGEYYFITVEEVFQ